MNNLGKRIIVIVLVLAVIVVGITIWWKGNAGDNSTNLGAVGSAVPNNSTIPAELATLTMDDQFPGPLVFVSAVGLPEGGWVVISREEDGQPGAVAGVGFFDKDVATGEVNLAVPTKEGEKYFALLYRDNGDLKFDTKTDFPYRDATGRVIMTSFTVTRNLPAIKG